MVQLYPLFGPRMACAFAPYNEKNGAGGFALVPFAGRGQADTAGGSVRSTWWM